MQCYLFGGGVLSHHIPIYIDGTIPKIGYARITNDGVILSIWIYDQEQLFVPDTEVTE